MIYTMRSMVTHILSCYFDCGEAQNNSQGSQPSEHVSQLVLGLCPGAQRSNASNQIVLGYTVVSADFLRQTFSLAGIS